MRHGLCWLALVLAQACDRAPTAPADAGAQRSPTGQSGRGPAPSASRAPPPASGPARLDAAPGLDCLSPQEIERDLATHYKLRSELGVVRVAPDDVLWLRERPGAQHEQVGRLAHDARGIRATGRACRVQRSMWLEVTSGAVRGWANDRFLLPSTKPFEQTERFTELLGDARFASAAELVAALRRELERRRADQAEPRFRAELVGMAGANARGVAILYLCCEADDSVLGEQVWLELHEQDGAWRLRRARVSRLCPRGTSDDRCL